MTASRAVTVAASQPLAVTIGPFAVLGAVAAVWPEQGADRLVLSVPAIAAAVVGGVVASRRPANPQGWMLGVFGMTLLVNQAALA